MQEEELTEQGSQLTDSSVVKNSQEDSDQEEIHLLGSMTSTAHNRKKKKRKKNHAKIAQLRQEQVWTKFYVIGINVSRGEKNTYYRIGIS